MTNTEQKQWILNNFKRSSGVTITEMLKRYWTYKKIDSFDYINNSLKFGKNEANEELL